MKGHNSIVSGELRSIVERLESLEAEKKQTQALVKEVMAEAKGQGFDTKILRKIIAIRKRKPKDVQEENALLEIYGSALGMEIFG